jgi:hypothetical protein
MDNKENYVELKDHRTKIKRKTTWLDKKPGFDGK